MTFEISEGGLSAATLGHLRVGMEVELSPVLDFKVKAIVRRKLGSMYGFEFMSLGEQQRSRIRNLCKELPLFQSTADV